MPGQTAAAAECLGLQAFSDVFPHLVTATNVPRLVKIADVDWSGVDAAFCCLPHATTQEILASLPREVRGCVRTCNHLFSRAVGMRACWLGISLMNIARAAVQQNLVYYWLFLMQIRVVDLSADFRLRNVDTYAEWCADCMALSSMREQRLSMLL